MWYVGLDVHSRSWTYVVLDEGGNKLRTRSGRGRWTKLLRELKEIKHPFAICFEASTGYGWLYDRLAKMARRVVVAHPGRLRLIFATKRKNDRIDANKLAMLLKLDAVPMAYVPGLEVRAWRRFIEHRHAMVAERTRVKNRIRALLRSQHAQAPKGLWSRRGLAWLGALEFADEMDAVQRDLLMNELESLEERIARAEAMLNKVGREDAGVQLLMTIPGVGPRTAEAVMAYVADPARFARSSQMASYFGLVPSQHQSGGTNRLGRITREGPRTVRKLLVEAAWQAIRRSPKMGAFYERICRGDTDRRKIAVVATAHYLVRIMHGMLSTGEVWRGSSAA